MGSTPTFRTSVHGRAETGSRERIGFGQAAAWIDGETALAAAGANSPGFAFNAFYSKDQVRETVHEFKDGSNPLGMPVGAAQADLVAHSMGGDIARDMWSAVDLSPDGIFSQGYVHKLITIGTPHLGSPLAVELLQDANACVRGVLGNFGMPSFQSVVVGGLTEDGGVGGLQGDDAAHPGLEGPGIQQIQGGGAEPPTAFITANTTAANLAALSCLACKAELLRFLCSGDALAQELEPQDPKNPTAPHWNALFGDADNDAVVSVNSQDDGMPAYAVPNSGYIHSLGLVSLDFSPPAELADPSGAIPNEVAQLLNTPVWDPQFSHLP